MGTWILIAIVLAVVAWAVMTYNKLINLRNAVKNAFAQIDVQLTRRYDLIPNLVEAVKGYMKHERETLEAVISARTRAVAGLKAAAAHPESAAGAVWRRLGLVVRTRPAVCAVGVVSGPEGRSQHDAAAGRTHQHREPRGVLPPGIQ
jgi:hypothetical protein